MRADINKTVLFTKTRNVKTPVRANRHDAGTDFFVPFYDREFLEILMIKNATNRIFYNPILGENGTIEDMEFIIPPGEQINIPSGIHVWILDKNTFLQATNKSGVASKFHLDVMANTVDADYQGEVHINLSNNGNTEIRIKTGQKLVQFIHKEYIDTDWQELSVEQYNKIETSDRGAGAFASTGTF